MTIDTLPLAGDFATRWQHWHAGRVTDVTAPFGPAALVSTTWLVRHDTAIDGVPGRWRAEGTDAVGTGLARSGYRGDDGDVTDEVRLGAGRAITDGLREIRGFVRDGRPAIRLLDATRPDRLSIAGIDTYAPDPTWRLPARFEPSPTLRRVVAIDGHTSTAPPGGHLVFVHDGEEYRLVAGRTERGFQVVFGDTTNGTETFRFRFLTVEPDDGAGLVVDFNRAYLPPCAFSDQYLCPLPSPQNLLPFAVRAGERSITRNGT